jgi:peptide/nickel transport system substrate-binding protein
MVGRLLLACVSACVVVGCSKAARPLEHSGTLVIAVIGEPISLNPLYLQGDGGEMIGDLGYSKLTAYDATGEIVTQVSATVPSVENGGISRDGKRITYHLRHGLAWQDGAPLTSQDIAFTYRAIMNPQNAVPSREDYERIAGIYAPDPYTVIVRLKHPYGPMVTSFFGPESNYSILPAHLLAQYSNLNQVSYNSAPIGSGPYRFTNWVRGDRLDLAANSRYYTGRPAIRNITLRFVPDSSTVVTELRTGEVDMAFLLDISKVGALRAIPGHRVVVTRAPSFCAVTFNVTDSIVKDVAVRRAFAMAIDRRLLVDKAAHGLYDPDTAMRGMFTWAFDPSVHTLPYDARRAESLLTQDGWIAGKDGIRVKAGRRLDIQLIFLASFMAADAIPVLVEEERAIGIDVTMKRFGSGNQFYALDGPLYQGRFQAAIFNYDSGFDPEPSWLLSCAQRAPNGFNWARYCNRAVDRAIRSAASVFHRAARRRAYSLVQRLLAADIPYDFLWQNSQIATIPSGLRGFETLISPYDSVARWSR